jgi:hypothetical protein
MNQQDDFVNEKLIEIRDPEIDTQAVLEQVRQRIKKRRAQHGFEPQSFPSFGGSGMPERLEESDLDPNLFHYLELVNKSYFDFATEPDLQLSPATRGRILGRIWSLIRRQAHQLVLFYVNRNIEHQVAVNRQLVSIVNLLARTLQEQQREISDLRQRLHQSPAGSNEEKGAGT